MMPTKSHKELYREAFLKVKADRGTPYDVSQEELDAMSTFSGRNFGPFVSQSQATKEVVEHNKPSRKPSSAELAAIQRLRSALKDSLWSPDIVIKAFHDLDMIFFLGRLHHNVQFQWRTPDAFVTHVQPEDFALGATVGTGRVGQMSIMLHAHNLLLRDVIRDPWMHMWSTALHEMCHAYEGVRAQTGMRAGHQMDFGLKIQAVHERAQGLFGLWAIVPAGELARCGLYQV
ncbi:hypothetical protein HO173_012322 [Letharia columbiana]|uniref:SprT-like domain-containing protein n=1 Tax=Letharia columbiana TaxID=112416 RepID=A0A8H6FGB3_9LECA|nr:uncharacterized protein HO173_012322 [Letharia columbiana]KAF6226818.1 hypothetical protein HO173_012322 [Letharia columbiana]